MLSHVHMVAIIHPEPNGMPKLLIWEALFCNTESRYFKLQSWGSFMSDFADSGISLDKSQKMAAM